MTRNIFLQEMKLEQYITSHQLYFPFFDTSSSIVSHRRDLT